MAPSPAQLKVREIWREFLIDVMFAKHYTVGYAHIGGAVARNPVVDRLLPSLLQVKAVSILDHALRVWIEENDLEVPRKPYGTDLKGRIDFLSDRKFLSDSSSLHAIRSERNALAHEPNGAIDWKALDTSISAIREAMLELDLPVRMQNWTIGAERSGPKAPRIKNALNTFEHLIAIKEGEKLIATITWQSHLMDDDA